MVYASEQIHTNHDDKILHTSSPGKFTPFSFLLVKFQNPREAQWQMHYLVPGFGGGKDGKGVFGSPHTQDAIVTTRIITCLVGNPYKPSVVTVSR